MSDEQMPDGTAAPGAPGRYRMTISRLTVDKLGVKLYDKVSAVIAELVANSYDADAEEVTVEAPMGETLASLSKGVVTDREFSISVRDTGHGMSPEVINDYYLKVGSERRSKNDKRGDISPKYERKVMGRKGVGKLAPFGICETLEIISSGGDLVDGRDENGDPARGFRTAHFIMHRSKMLIDDNSDYKPEIGPLDGTVRSTTGTCVTMRHFNRRRVPDMETFSRQLAQRFGVSSDNWKINLIDTTKDEGEPNREKPVGKFAVATMPNTKINFVGPPETESIEASEKHKFIAKDESGEIIPDITAGFESDNTELELDSRRFYPITGWVAYAKESYRDDLMAGIRIYCRGKIAAQTAVFNRKAGFTGEHSVRSYLVGELHADWLDEEEDLIQTDRRDILWSDELGRKFEEWGQKIVKLVGTKSREPEKEMVSKVFLKTGNVEEKINQAYPGERWRDVREKAMILAKQFGKGLRISEAEDRSYVDSLVQCSIVFAPHISLGEAMKQAASNDKTAVFMANLLRTARIAELSSYGKIAEDRVKVIERFTKLKNHDEILELHLQEVIEDAPWLINPYWSPVTQNQQLSTFRREFKKHFKEETGEDIHLELFDKNDSNKCPDFVMIADNSEIQIIEIKRPKHKLKDSDWERIRIYIKQMEKFLERNKDQITNPPFDRFAVTLVCNDISLSDLFLDSFNKHKNERILTHITWTAFLSRTERTHKEFLEEAENLKRRAVK